MDRLLRQMANFKTIWLYDYKDKYGLLYSIFGNNLYILDRNIRMATMLGIVGAGGIGYELQSSFRMFEYPKVSAIIIIIFITIFLIDNLSSYIRSKIS